ncbi:MAG: prepilin-type N-terminal cleavage/methylation domain-containing protein [Candidatus Saccharibacteria bacterium]
MTLSRNNHTQNGFTILELMIATTVFSTILLVCTYGLIQIGNTYYKGATTARVQSVARSIVDDISYEIQFSTVIPEVFSTPTTASVCIGPTRFSAKKGVNVGTGVHALLFQKNSSGPCTALASGKELLGDNMRLTEFSVTQYPANVSVPDYYIIKLNIVYGDTNLADSTDPNVCKGGVGSQFCASAHLETTVRRRKS